MRIIQSTNHKEKINDNNNSCDNQGSQEYGDNYNINNQGQGGKRKNHPNGG